MEQVFGLGIQPPSKRFSRLLNGPRRRWLILDGGEDEAKKLYDAGKVEYLIWRLYNANVMAISPHDWVAVAKYWLTVDRGGWRLIDIVDEVVLDNELNLAIEHGEQFDVEGHSWWCTEEGYTAIDNWKGQLATEWHFQMSDVPNAPLLAWGPLSPGHDPRTGNHQYPEGEYVHLENSLIAYHIVHIHSYGDPDDQWTGGRYRRVFSALPASVSFQVRLTEWNWPTATQDQIQKVHRILREIDSYYFIWSSAGEDHLAFELLTSVLYPVVYNVQEVEEGEVEVPLMPTIEEIVNLQLAIQTDVNDWKIEAREKFGELADVIIGTTDEHMASIIDKAGQSVGLLNQLPK